MKINLTPLHKTSLAEVGQTHDIKFAHIVENKNEFQILHTPAKCREFLNDYANYIWLDAHNKPRYSVYGYTVKKEHDPRDQKMWWKFTGTLATNFKKNFHIVLELDKALDTKPTQILYEGPDGFVLQYDPFWENVTFLFTYHTLIIKLAAIMPEQKNLMEMVTNAADTTKLAPCNETYIAKPLLKQLQNGLNQKLKKLTYNHPTGNDWTPSSSDHAWGIGNFCQMATNPAANNSYAKKLASM